MSYILTSDEDGSVDFVVRRDGKKTELDGVKFDLHEYNDGKRYIKLDFFVYGEKRSFGSVLKNAGKTVLSNARIVFMSLGDLLTGRYGINDMSGPVGITVAIGDAARQSLSSALYLACLITVNLGIFNMLPIPALDGSRALFIIIEMIRRKPVPAKYEGIVHTVGFIALLALMAVVMFIDIYKLFT